MSFILKLIDKKQYQGMIEYKKSEKIVIPNNEIAGNNGDVIIGALSVDTAIVQDMPPFQITGDIHYKNGNTEYIPFKFQLQNGNVTLAIEDFMKSYTNIDFVVFNAFTTSFSRSIG